MSIAKQFEPLLSRNWKLVDINGATAIQKQFIFRDFRSSFSFMTFVALEAEKVACLIR
jgi:pterin-4a-carbinolamine dehydratase